MTQNVPCNSSSVVAPGTMDVFFHNFTSLSHHDQKCNQCGAMLENVLNVADRLKICEQHVESCESRRKDFRICIDDVVIVREKEYVAEQEAILETQQENFELEKEVRKYGHKENVRVDCRGNYMSKKEHVTVSLDGIVSIPKDEWIPEQKAIAEIRRLHGELVQTIEWLKELRDDYDYDDEEDDED